MPHEMWSTTRRSSDNPSEGEHGFRLVLPAIGEVNKSPQPSPSSSPSLYAVGDIGPAGGYIFYDKGYYSDGWRYLEVASESYEFIGKVWGGSGTTVGVTKEAIGTGKSNTEKIVAEFGNAEPYEKKTDYAAKLCADLVVLKDGVKYDDWFLPSKDELKLICERNLLNENLGGFSGSYWSSSAYYSDAAWYQYFKNGDQQNYYRYYGNRVRPVRTF